jgi:2,3-dihydroxybenzoate decarboxylase
MSNEQDNRAPSRRRFVSQLSAIGTAIGLGVTGVRNADAQTKGVTVGLPQKVRKIALEEHFMHPDFIEYFAGNKECIKPELYDKVIPILEDFGASRLDVMDKNGIDFAVLSLSGPGLQVEKDTAKAVRLQRVVNDSLAKEVHKRPDRYGGFAHLAMQDPKAAADELERCVKQLGFRGAMINGATNGVYLDDRRYDVFWERVQALDVPIYLHPANPFDYPAMYKDHPELWGPTWSWAVETCNHAMRLIFSGVFDRFPKVQIILGHMGETLPIQPWRLDSRYAISNQRYKIAKKPSEYVNDNFYITTSGVCSDPALRCTIDTLGIDRVMFSVDYPYESTEIASRWISTANVTETERAKVAFQNATRLLKL